MTQTYYKAVRLNGTDFHTGTIDYLAEGVIEHPDAGRKNSGDASGYLSVSTTATDCTGFSWPARLLEVEVVGETWTPHVNELPNKRAVKALRVVRELDAGLLLGPQAEQIIALVERAKTLTYDEARSLDAARAAAWDAAWDAARAAAWAAARAAASHAARAAAWDAARAAAWDAARYAAWDAALGLVIRDRIGNDGLTQEYYDTLTGPWRKAIGKIHPEDEDLK